MEACLEMETYGVVDWEPCRRLGLNEDAVDKQRNLAR